MKRDIDKLRKDKFDVLIIGGGIHGASIVWECARNGYKACLIEKNDFGSATSSNSLKVLHGGLRYLQHANIKRMRESIYSRKIFQQLAPHLVKNIPFVIPTSGFGIKSRIALSIAMKLNDIISFDRNKDIDQKCFIPGGKTISKDELNVIIPGLDENNYSGGAVWFESIALNTERLLNEFLFNAYDNGATVLNYIKAKDLVIEKNEISKVIVVDELTGEEFFVKIKVVVDSVGPWLNQFLEKTEDLKKLKSPLTKAINIIVKKKYFDEYSVGLESIKEFTDKSAVINKGKRLFFFVPIGNYTMIGTTYKIYKDIPDNCKIEKHDIQEIIDEVNSIYKPLKLKYEDVTHAHVGAQAMPNMEIENEFDVQADTHSLVFDHSTEGTIKNLISIKSVKYTTAPSIAKNVISLLDKKRKIVLNKSAKKYSSIKENYSNIKNDFFSNNNKYEINYLERLWNTYGVRSQKVINYVEEDKESSKLLIEKGTIYVGELKYNVNEEMAIFTDDIVNRRLGISAFEKISHADKVVIDNFLKEFKC